MLRTVESAEDPRLSARLESVQPLVGSNGEFVRAGSALLKIGRRLLAVQDDAWQAWWISLPKLALTPLLLQGSGRRRRKKRKPDLEAALLHGGDLWILGSGSTHHRHRIARIGQGGSGRASLYKRAQLYRALERALGAPPNIEGAIHWGGGLRLLNRDTRGQHNAVFDLPLDVLRGRAPARVDVTRYSLGSVSTYPLSFGDAAVAGSRWFYLATAERSADNIADGPIAGAALGVVDGAARWTQIRERDGRASRRKFEGLVLDTDLRGAWLLTDPDDPGRPAEVCRVRLRGFA